LLIGAHVSTSGGVERAIDNAKSIGAECVQIFPSSPQSWRSPEVDELSMTNFKTRSLEARIGPNVFHGIYLINLASDDTKLVERGKESLIRYMNLAEGLGVLGVIFHLNSHKGLGFERVSTQLIENLTEVLAQSPPTVQLILENSAGAGNHIGSRFIELGIIVRCLADERVGVCLDTQHAFAAGYDMTTSAGVDQTLEELDREVGLGKLAAVHCNDSKVPLGAGRDRHENIGCGEMGIRAFESILGHPSLHGVPFYLEVPGFSNKGPDKENIDLLKEIRSRQGWVR